MQFLHRFAANVAHRDLRVFAFALGLFDQLPTALLGELRHGHPDQGAVIAGVQPEIRVANRGLDGAELIGFVRLDDDKARLGDVDAGQLCDRGVGAVVLDDDPREHARVGAAGPDG